MQRTINEFGHPALTCYYWRYWGIATFPNSSPYTQHESISPRVLLSLEHMVDGGELLPHMCWYRKIFSCCGWTLYQMVAVCEVWESKGIETTEYFCEVPF